MISTAIEVVHFLLSLCGTVNNQVIFVIESLVFVIFVKKRLALWSCFPLGIVLFVTSYLWELLFFTFVFHGLHLE